MPFLYEKELQAIVDALTIAGERAEFRRAGRSDLKYLIDAGYPMAVCNFYRNAEPAMMLEINDVRLYPIADMKIENENAVPGCVIASLGYRVIGSTIIGDAYCIDLNSVDSDGQSNVVLASHDEIYEDASETEIRAGIAEVADTFREFLRRLAAADLPLSFYDTGYRLDQD
jgi:hypothetical protein